MPKKVVTQTFLNVAVLYITHISGFEVLYVNFLRQFGMSLHDSMGELLPTVDVSDHEIPDQFIDTSALFVLLTSQFRLNKEWCCRNMIV